MQSKYDKNQEKMYSFREQLPKPDSEWFLDVSQAIAIIHNHLYD